MRAKGGFHKWRHVSHGAERHTVFPDGCRDVLIIRGIGEPDRVVLTELDFQPRNVELPDGTKTTGYRLRPGAVVSRDALEGIAANHHQAENILDDDLGAWSEIDDAILALTRPGASVASVARDLGVSVRTMQRRFLSLNLPVPDFWRLLGRARRAVGMISLAAPLADVACACCYSDQAHMTRDLARWFGVSPARLRRDAGLLAMLSQPALANWTGEQISTR